MSRSKYSLASNQYDIWLDQAFYSESPLYNIGGYICIYGEMNAPLLNSALTQLINESDSLRLSLNSDVQGEGGEVSQVVSEKLIYDMEYIDFSSKDEPEADAQSWVNDAFKTPFQMTASSRLWQIALLKISEHRYFFVTKYHHLIADGWATRVMFTRLSEIYNALLEQQIDNNIPKHQYIDFLEQEQSYLSSAAYKKDKTYWQGTLSHLPPSLIEKKKTAQNEYSLPEAIIHRFFLQRSLYNQLEDFSAKNKVTTYHLILSAVALYFSRIYQRDEIVIGLPGLNRSGAKYKDVIGLFVKFSPLFLKVNLEDNVHSLVKLCGKTLRDNYRHQRFPLGEIYKHLDLIKNKRNSVFDIAISYERQEHSMLFGGAKVSAHQQFSGVARYPLGITICEFNQLNDVEIVVEGADDSFSPNDLEQFGRSLTHILEQMISSSDIKLSRIDLLPASDEVKLFEPFSGNTEPSTENVIQSFTKNVLSKPQFTALEFAHERLTYQQLDEKSNQLAHYLIELGAKKEQIIAISLPRTAEMIISILAILKTGAADRIK